MATHKSALKRAKQNETRRGHNTAVKSAIKTKMKNVLAAVEGKDKEEAAKALSVAVPAISKAAGKGALHKNTASRRISRLTKKVNSLKG